MTPVPVSAAAWSLETHTRTGPTSTQCRPALSPGAPPSSRGLSCLVTGDSYRTHFHPVLASTLTRSSPQLQRLEVWAQQSSKDSAFWRQVYFHCMAVVCDPNLEDTCNKTCVPGAQRSAPLEPHCLPPSPSSAPLEPHCLPPSQSLLSSTRATLPPSQSLLSSTRATLPPSQSLLSSTRATLPPSQSLLSSTRATLLPSSAPRATLLPSLPQSLLSSTRATLPPSQSRLSSTRATLPPSLPVPPRLH
ncbi:UNVERIFIED_CONTAM: hypothetical protein FKN15_070897 [Acipenser sinensis]